MGIILILVVVVIVFAVLNQSWHVGGPAVHTRIPLERDDPLEILKKRYARGEIGKAEFEEKKKDLQ